MRHVLAFLFLVASCAGVANATPAIDVGTFNLLPNTAGQNITLQVTGGDAVSGFNLRAQINDGTGSQNEPIFQAVTFTGGTIWDARPFDTIGGPVQGAPSDVQASVVVSPPPPGATVPASGNLVILTISTVGIPSGNFPLLLKGTEIGLDSRFIVPGGAETPTNITNGMLIVAAPEPAMGSFVCVVAAGALPTRNSNL